MNSKTPPGAESTHVHTEPQQRVADLWMLAILILFFWPFLLIDWALEKFIRRTDKTNRPGCRATKRKK